MDAQLSLIFNGIAALSTFFAAIAAMLSWQTGVRAEVTAKRSTVLMLVDLFKTLPEINASTSEDDIRMSISIFDYIGHLIDAGVVESEMIEIIWGDFISRGVDALKARSDKLPNCGQTPIELLASHPKVQILSDDLRRSKAKRLSHS